MRTWLKAMMASTWMVIGVCCAGAASELDAPVQAGITASRDHLLGWYELPNRHYRTREVLPGPGTLIPVMKIDGSYYSVCRGFEAPLKPCAEGLEWAFTPSSMGGTVIGYDKELDECYIRIVDSRAQYEADLSTSGEKQSMMRIVRPSWLLDATAKRPLTNDDFVGWYQSVWLPYLRFELRKEGAKYYCEWQVNREGASHAEESRELTPLSDQLGFTGFDRRNQNCLVYNETLKRFEIIRSASSVIRMPLARVPIPPMTAGGVPMTPIAIGIPSWH